MSTYTIDPPESKRSRLADPVEVFTARCEARAHLVKTGDLDLQSAADVLQDAAERTGLVTSLGQDAVQAIIADAFHPAREAGERAEQAASEILAQRERAQPECADEYDGLSSTFAAACRLADVQHRGRVPQKQPHDRVVASTLMAAEYLVQQDEPKRLGFWLLEHDERERAGIIDHIDRKAQS